MVYEISGTGIIFFDEVEFYQWYCFPRIVTLYCFTLKIIIRESLQGVLTHGELNSRRVLTLERK